MSLSKPTVQNPCEQWICFKGGEGVFKFWNSDEQKEVEMELPLKFIVLDELIKVTGYNKVTDSGIYSNEVRSTRKEKLHIRTWKGVDELQGFYSDIRNSIVAWGGKFTKSIYAALITPDGLKMVNFEFRGAAFSKWLNWSKKKPFDKIIVTVVETKEDSNGSISFKVPVFGMKPMEPELLKEAMQMDQELQAYLKTRSEKLDNDLPEDNSPTDDPLNGKLPDEPDPDELEDMPF